MKKSTKNLLYVIGGLSIVSGLYSLFTGGEMYSYLSGIFIGVALIGSVVFEGKEK